jgi:acyl transferase domain-containing protein
LGHCPAFAGVSSFGIGGTNAHLILQEPPEAKQINSLPELDSYPLIWSAQSQSSLMALLAKTVTWLRRQEHGVSLYQLGFQLSCKKSRFKYLFETSVRSVDELLSLLGDDRDHQQDLITTHSSLDYSIYDAPAPLLDLPRYPWNWTRSSLDDEASR